MPGNEVGERVHNFFAPDNLSQGQHHSQVVDGNWQVAGNNLWVGNQRHIGGPSSNSKIYSQQLSDNERGNSSHSIQVPHGLSFTQSTPRPDLLKTESQSPQPNLNGYFHGHQVFKTRQNEANFLGVDTESDQCNITSEGLSIYELQHGNGPEQHTKISVRSETSEPPVGFDFFVGQQQMGSQQPRMLQSLVRQQSGYNEMQLHQQEVMFRKIQELQRQQQLQQLEARRQNSINQFSTIAKQGSGNHSPALISGTPLTEATHYPWATEVTAGAGTTSWMQRASPTIQGSSNGLMFSPEQGQAMRVMDLVPQQVDQSLYGVPISSTRGNQNQYSRMTIDMPPVQQTSTCSNSFPGNHYAVYPDQVSMQDGTLVSGQGFQEKDTVGHTSGQSLNSGMNFENLQQVNALQRNASMQEFGRRQELATSLETVQEKSVMQVAPLKNAVALDPTEEKILFGADDENIWDAFGGSIHMSTGGSNLLDGTGFLNGFPSLQSGSWSALMQSAVAETSSNEGGVQEEWTGLSFQNTELPMGNHQPSTCNNSGKQQTFLADNNLQIASALSSGSVPLSGNANMKNNYLNVPASQQSGHKISYEHGEQSPGILSHISIPQSSEEGSRWLDRGPLQKPLAEGSRVHGNASHSVDDEINAKGITGSWTPQQPIPSYRTGGQPGGQPCNKPIDRNDIESVSPSLHAPLKIHENENSVRHWRSNDKGPISEEMGNVGGIWKADSLSNSTVELEHARSAMGSPEVNREDSSFNTVGVLPISSTTRARQETRQLLPNSRHLNYWRDVNSSMKCEGSEASGKPQHYLNKNPQVPELSVNISDRETVKMHEMENCDIKENSGDSYHSNLSHHNSTGGFRDNILSDASDSRIPPAGKQKSSGQAARKTSAPRKFQYHPMGNLDEDVEPSHGTKHSIHSQAVSQQMSRGSKSHGRHNIGQSKLFGHGSKNSLGLEKGHLPDLQGNTKVLDEVPSRGILPGSMRNMSAPFDRSVGIYAPDKTTQSSQNMLELLHKVDQSRECGTVMPFNSSERNPSFNMPKEDNAEGSVSSLQQNQYSASQGFSLQLAPPSQRLPVLNHAHTVNSDGLSLTTPEMKDKGHTWLASAGQVQSLPPSHETSQVEFRNSRTDIPGQTGNDASQHYMHRNVSSAFTSGFPFSRSQNQDQCMTNTSGLVTTNQSTDISFDKLASHSKQADESYSRALSGQSAMAFLPDTAGRIPHNNPASSVDAHQPTGTNYSHGISAPQISAGEAVPVSQLSIATSGTSGQSAFSKVLPNIWTSVPTSFPAQQRVLGAQPRKSPLNFFQSNRPNNNVESTSFASQNLEDEDPHKGSSGPSAFVASSTNSHGFVCGEEHPARDSPGQQVSSVNIDLRDKISASQGRESMSKHLSDVTPSSTASVQRDVEAFGRSLKPNNYNYSLLHQMQVMRSAESDPSDRDLNRFQGTHSGQGGLQVAPSTGQSNDHHTRGGDALVRHNVVLSGDSEMLSFSGPVNNWEANPSSQLRNDPQIYPRSNNMATVRVEHSQISPQMAPSWFNQFGTLKKGQMLPMYDSQKIAAVKSLGQPFTLAKPSDSLHAHNSTEQVIPAADTSQVDNTWRTSTPKAVAVEYLSSPHLLPPDVTDQRLVVVRSKKRKSAISELLPWHKEVIHGSQSLQTISIAEVDWAKAANRLIDKVEDGAESIEDGSPMIRPKKRLILTTQLMQQLFHPPPAAVLSADAVSNYESLVCLVARLSLGDSCSLISCCESNSHAPLDSLNLISDKCKSSERINDQHLSKVTEDFILRARKLENDLLRLDKGASVLDLRVECQDIEKYSVINRFAKFHGRGQADGAENSSSSNAATIAQKPCPQRYVSALPMPRNIPDRVQCLSL